MDKNEDGYDREEMKMREFAFELSKLDVVLKAFLALSEWKQMKERFGFSDEDFPNMSRYLQPAREILDNNSAAYKSLFENPLFKLAVISQPPQPDKPKE